MARKPRIHFPGAFYHVILRGNAGQDIFFRVADRSKLYLLLQQGTERYKHRIHAFCCMTNHIHLVIQVLEIPLSRIIQNLSFRYTRHINSNRNKTGHLFQGRYKAIVIDADNYLLELVRYIHLNPVRAHMVKLPQEFKWSSHRCYIGGTKIPWLTTSWVLGQFGEKEDNARRLYEQFVLQDLHRQSRKEFQCGTHEGRILGSDSFAEVALVKANEQFQARYSIDDIVSLVSKESSIEPRQILQPGRNRNAAKARALIAYLVLESKHITLTELSKHLNRDLSGLSQAANRLQKRMQNDRALQVQVKGISTNLQRCP